MLIVLFYKCGIANGNISIGEVCAIFSESNTPRNYWSEIKRGN